MITYFKIDENNILQKETKEETNIIHFYNITEEEKDIIIKKYNIDEHSLNSCLDPDEVARIEFFDFSFNLNMIWKIPTCLKVGDITSFDVISAGFFIRDGKLIIISNEYLVYLNEKITLNISNIEDYKYLLYNIIIIIQYLTSKHFIEHLKAIKILSRELQKKIYESFDNEHLLYMFDLSEILIYYIDSINSNKIILNKYNLFLKNKRIHFNESYFQDLLNEIDQAHKQAEIYSQVLAGLMDARGNIINNNMNTLIKNLTIINTIFLPLNLIASIGGMSEYSAITSHIPWPISYGLFSIALVIIGWITLLLINKSTKNKNRINKK